MIFQKINLTFLIILLIGILFVVVIGFTYDPCGLSHVLILNEISSYEQSLDPEFCENVVERIDLHNDQCNSYIETLDCG